MHARSLVPKPLRPTVGRTLREATARGKRMVPNWDMDDWKRRAYAMPAPSRVKWSVLHRYGRAADTWIETGTWLGDTTAFLAKSARHVYSIEPGPAIAERARQRFKLHTNVTIVEGLSEDHLAGLLNDVDGPVSLWLDGHFSAGTTHQGPLDTPIREELETVERNLSKFREISVLVDDVRCFDPTHPEYPSYPNRSWLVHWADANGLVWTIEQDIFIALKGR